MYRQTTTTRDTMALKDRCYLSTNQLRMASASIGKKKEIIVLGAGERIMRLYELLPTSSRFEIGSGVVGLTTALKIQLRGTYQVTIVSEIIPSDPKSIKYTSRWAVRL